jgi:hypothetical protein
MMPLAFDAFWNRVLTAQGEDIPKLDRAAAPLIVEPTLENGDIPESRDSSSEDRLCLELDNPRLHCKVEGSARALADFWRIVSAWEAQ